MNQIEKSMAQILAQLRRDFGAVAVKAEFEAEGTRTDELLRLLDIASSSNIGLTLKIGGCEAVRDLHEAKQFGASYVVAPMIESAYALSKYIGAIRTVYDVDEANDAKFLFNVETELGYQALGQMIETINREKPRLDGIVFGRVDFVGSLGLERADVLNSRVTEAAISVASSTLDAGLEFVIGGGVSADSVDVLKRVREVHLSRFETRKIVFSGESIEGPEIQVGLLSAVKFELLWLENKQRHYARISKEDQTRMDLLQSRWNLMLNQD